MDKKLVPCYETFSFCFALRKFYFLLELSFNIKQYLFVHKREQKFAFFTEKYLSKQTNKRNESFQLTYFPYKVPFCV